MGAKGTTALSDSHSCPADLEMGDQGGYSFLWGTSSLSQQPTQRGALLPSEWISCFSVCRWPCSCPISTLCVRRWKKKKKKKLLLFVPTTPSLNRKYELYETRVGNEMGWGTITGGREKATQKESEAGELSNTEDVWKRHREILFHKLT